MGRMFTLDVSVPELKAAMFTQGLDIVANILRFGIKELAI